MPGPGSVPEDGFQPQTEAETRLEVAERRSDQLFRHYPVPCEVWQRRGDGFVLVDYNEADRVYTDDAIQPFVGRDLHFVHPEESAVAAHVERCYQEQAYFTREIPQYRLQSTGEVRDLVVTFVWIEPDLVLTIIDDVSDERAAQGELKRLSSAVEQTADAVFITDRAGTIEYVNPGFEEITGYERAEVLGKTPRILKSGQAEPEYYERLWSTLLAGEVFRAEAVNRKYDGTLFVAEQTITPMKDPDGEITHFVSVLKDMTERRALADQRRLFERMVSPGVIEQLNPDSLRLGGASANITILFADIRDFTSFSETQTPEQLVSTLNRYLAAMADAVLAQEGTIDKFMGDAIMAWFNAPIPQPDHTLRAVRAALAIRDAVEDLHRELPEESRLAVGVGIHCGDAVLGLIGTDRRMEYTAISDSVNTAKRLQENSAPNQIIISSDAYERVRDTITVGALDPIRVKGKRRPLEVFEITGLM
jgi:PAS domain S-box-containing protein